MVTLSSFCQPYRMKRKWSPMFSCYTDLGDPECDQGTKHVTLLNLVFIKYVSTISSTQSPEGRSFQDRVDLAPFFPKLLLGGLYLVMSVSSKLLKFKAKKSLIGFLLSHLYPEMEPWNDVAPTWLANTQRFHHLQQCHKQMTKSSSHKHLRDIGHSNDNKGSMLLWNKQCAYRPGEILTSRCSIIPSITITILLQTEMVTVATTSLRRDHKQLSHPATCMDRSLFPAWADRINLTIM